MKDKELFEFFVKHLKMTESLIPELEHCIGLEKQDMSAKAKKLSRSAASLIVMDLTIHRRLLQRFKQNQFLSVNLVDEYERRLQHIQDKAKSITIRENLQRTDWSPK